MLVFCDPSNLQDLAAAHTEWQKLGEWANARGHDRGHRVCLAVTRLIESVILQEGPDPRVLPELMNGAVAGLQRLVRDGVNDKEVDYPALLLEEAVDGAARSSRFAVSLPAHVDESIFEEFLSKQECVLEEMEGLVLGLEGNLDEQKLAALKRLLHTLKGESALLGLSDVEHLCHLAEDGIAANPPIFSSDNLLALKDWLKRAFDFYSGKTDLLDPPESLMSRFGMKDGQTAETRASTASAEVASPRPAPVSARGIEKPLRFEAKPLEADPDLLSDFVAEAMEHLDNSDVHLLTIETEPGNQDALNAVFRAFHTIKGVAGFLALEEIQALAHDAENLLDGARKGACVLEGAMLDLVFDSVDVMKHCVGNVSHALASGEPLEVVESLPDLVLRVRKALRGEPFAAEAALPAVIPGQRLGEALVDSGAATSEAVSRALQQQLAPAAPKKLGEVLVEQGYTSSLRVQNVLRIQEENPEKRIGEILEELGAVDHEDISEALDVQTKKSGEAPKLGELLVRAGEADPAEIARILRAQKGLDKKGSTVQVREAVKVDSDRLDLLVDTIGELVIAESMVAQSQDLVANASQELKRQINQLDKITRELQVMAMSLRMVPVRSTFQKMARLVRDLSKKTGKSVDFHMSGEDTELDKTVVDRIGDPLVHIIRNAVDHGIEKNPEARKSLGKPATGNVHLRAFHAGGNIHIQVEDDGRGLDRQTIINKAVERRLISEGADLSDRDVFNLVFEPGFSTAEQITEVSGRGVGMDVVKRNIEALRGKTDIRSTPGHGSVFTIQLPLTLAIIDGMVVRVGVERFVIPTLAMVLSVRPDAEDIHTVTGRGEVLSLQGSLLPLYRLNRIFGVDGGVEIPTEGTVIVLEHDGRRAGLLVDEILGQQQIVIKSLGEALRGLPGLAGGAIMPDGRVGLILDAAGVVQLAEGADSA